jgi:hypothetical protein
VHALVLLGDNFYPDGLREEELVPRVRANVARPFCPFLASGAPRFGELAGACDLADAERRPVPIVAVLGNHDRVSPESARLQRDVLPRFVANWRLPSEPAAVVELGEGVSLIAFDSNAAFAGEAAAGGDLAALADALRSARGPWRVLLAHHPVAGEGRGDERARYRRYRDAVLEAIEASGVRVQLALAGHEHNLQVLAMEPPGPALQVISGAAAAPRSIRDENPSRLFGVSRVPGFARIDLLGSGDAERLVVSLVLRPRWPRRALGATQLAARFSVDRQGRVAEE